MFCGGSLRIIRELVRCLTLALGSNSDVCAKAAVVRHELGAEGGHHRSAMRMVCSRSQGSSSIGSLANERSRSWPEWKARTPHCKSGFEPGVEVCGGTAQSSVCRRDGASVRGGPERDA